MQNILNLYQPQSLLKNITACCSFSGPESNTHTSLYCGVTHTFLYCGNTELMIEQGFAYVLVGLCKDIYYLNSSELYNNCSI